MLPLRRHNWLRKLLRLRKRNNPQLQLQLMEQQRLMFQQQQQAVNGFPFSAGAWYPPTNL